ncbi:MAG: hypothetical protein JNM66_11385 [Bryobacterales bacterium]|nr:hypothetical protein [Bryobacterales bacterium]
MLGILVYGDNHFIVAGPRPDAEKARALARQWTVIQIGGVAPVAGWEMRTRAFREDLRWATVVEGGGAQSAAVQVLLEELGVRGVVIDHWPER